MIYNEAMDNSGDIVESAFFRYALKADAELGRVLEIDLTSPAGNSFPPHKLRALGEAMKGHRDCTVIFSATPVPYRDPVSHPTPIFSTGYDLHVYKRMAYETANGLTADRGGQAREYMPPQWSGALDTGVKASIYNLWYLYRIIQQHPRPTVALVDGHVYGGANGIVFACSHIVATPRTRFIPPVEEILKRFARFVLPLLKGKVTSKGRNYEELGLPEDSFSRGMTASDAQALGIVDAMDEDLRRGLESIKSLLKSYRAPVLERQKWLSIFKRRLRKDAAAMADEANQHFAEEFASDHVRRASRQAARAD